MERNKVDSALYVCDRALNLRKEINSDRGIISSHTRFGEIYNKLKNYALAEEQYLIALSYLAEDTYLKKKINLYLALARNYASMKKHGEAEVYYEKHLEAYNKFMNESNIEDITTLKKDFEFDAERKERDAKRNIELQHSEAELAIRSQRNQWLLIGGSIVSLLAIWGFIAYLKIRRSQKKIAGQKLKLEQSVKDKELLLKEIHHRVKNNLQIISSILKSQGVRSDDSRFKELMTDGQNRIKTMAMIHEKLYQNDDFRSIDFKNYTSELSQGLDGTYRKETNVAIVLNIPKISFHIDIAIPLGLILNELLTNCYKYAFESKSAGNIQISLDEGEAENFTLKVEDNGKGMPDDYNLESSKSLGLSMVKGLAWQLNGSMNYTSGKFGTVVSIDFKNHLKEIT